MNFIFRIEGPDTSRVFPIPQGTTTIGRDSSREIVLSHPLVSRLHARLTCSEEECQITDPGSANGTLVGEKALTPKVPYVLQPGDSLTIGPFTLVFEIAPSESQAEGEGSQPAGPELAEAEGSGPGPEQAVEADASAGEQAVPAEKPPSGEQAEPPAPPPPGPQEIPVEEPGAGQESPVPPGLSIYSRQLLQYLPGVYNTDFMSRFLALFESILIPIEWNVDNFDLFLDPGTSPTGFLPWLARWFEVIFDDSWGESQRRAFLKDAHLIYARHGTRWALGRVLEIYTGFAPEIVDTGKDLEPHTFMVRFPFSENHRRQDLLGRIIDEHKPAHTTYTVKFKG